MFDETLREDLLNIDVGANTIDTINYRRREILKIIKCRTEDKISILNFLFQNNAIDYDCYTEMMYRAKSDYKRGHLYLLGLCDI